MRKASGLGILGLLAVLLPVLGGITVSSASNSVGVGGTIAFVSDRDGNGEIYVMNADGSRQRNLTKNPANDGAPSWSRDGRKIVFTSTRDGNTEIYVMNADGSEQRRLTRNRVEDVSPAWSPDGKKITFTSSRDRPEIYVMNNDGSNQQRLTRGLLSGHAIVGRPAWSPDGRRIAFQSDRDDGKDEIYVMSPDGGKWQRLTTNPESYDCDAAWSPNGRKIAFGRDLSGFGSGELAVMNADGSGQRRLTRYSATSTMNYCPNPFWSHDGRKLAFASTRTGNAEIYVISDGGGGQRRLTQNQGADTDPTWKPALA